MCRPAGVTVVVNVLRWRCHPGSMYGFCDGNAATFSEPQHTNPMSVYTGVHQTLPGTVHLPAFALQLMSMSNKHWSRGTGKSTLRNTNNYTTSWRCPNGSMGDSASRRGCVQQVQHFRLDDFARRLEFWNWINGNRRLHRHSLLTDEVQANRDGTNNTILICSQKRTLTPLWKATFNFVAVSMCVVEFWMISCLVLSSSKVVLQERCTCDFCRTNCPNFFLFLWGWGGLWINYIIKYVGTPPFSREVRYLQNERFPGR